MADWKTDLEGWLVAQGLTPAQLAEKLGMGNSTTVYRWLRGTLPGWRHRRALHEMGVPVPHYQPRSKER